MNMVLDKRAGKLNMFNFTCVFLAVTIFLDIDPFFVWSSFAGGIGGTFCKIMQTFTILLLIVQLPFNHMQTKKLLMGVAIFGIFLFYCFCTGKQGGTTHPLLIGNVLVYFFYALNIMSNNEILLNSFILLRKIFAAVLCYTLIIYVLILIGIPIPFSQMQSGEAGRNALGWQIYQNYLGCILIKQYDTLLYRFTSVFTEPGVVGTFCAFFLAADGFHIKKKKQNWLFLIAGILSFSLAFYIMAILGYGLKSLRKGGYKFFVSILVIFAMYSIFMNINFSNPTLQILQERFVITSDGLAGDNRFKAEAEYDAFLNSDLKTVLFGYGNAETDADGLSAWQSTSSYKESIYCLGFVGYGLMIAWFIIAPLACYKTDDKRQNHMMYSYLIIFILSQYQRPYMKSWFLVYILLAGCIYAREFALVAEKNEKSSCSVSVFD